MAIETHDYLILDGRGYVIGCAAGRTPEIALRRWRASNAGVSYQGPLEAHDRASETRERERNMNATTNASPIKLRDGSGGDSGVAGCVSEQLLSQPIFENPTKKG